MDSKLVAIRYPKVYHNMYKVNESGGTYYVYHATGTVFTNLLRLGTTRSLADSIEIIKADVGASRVEFEIRDW
jgi:hypothetical protein